MSDISSLSACPACSAAPLAQAVARSNSGGGELVLSLPHIHCAGCIRGVESALLAVPGVKGARVNLSRKRVSIDAGPTLAVLLPSAAAARALKSPPARPTSGARTTDGPR